MSPDLIKSTASQDVGFFGIFSGEQKNRINLGGVEDKTQRLAIAYFKDKDIADHLQFKQWVPYTLSDGKTTVRAEIASIAARLNLTPSEIVRFAKKNELNAVINQKVEAYKADLRKVKKFYHLVSGFLDFSESGNINQNSFLSKVKKFDPSKIKNKEIRGICDKYKKQLLRTLAKTPPLSDKIENVARAKTKIENHLKEFYFDLFHADRNFSMKISPSKNVIRRLWNSSYNLVYVAKKIGGVIKKLSIRLQLFNNDVKNRFSILTDGNIYHYKPGATREYIPYSKDGKTWLLLSVKSLASRLHLSTGNIRASAGTDYIDRRIRLIEKFRDDLNHLIVVELNELEGAKRLKEKWDDLFNSIVGQDPLLKEFNQLARFVRDKVMKIKKESLLENKSSLETDLKNSLGWDPFEDSELFFIRDASDD